MNFERNKNISSTNIKMAHRETFYTYTSIPYVMTHNAATRLQYHYLAATLRHILSTYQRFSPLLKFAIPRLRPSVSLLV